MTGRPSVPGTRGSGGPELIDDDTPWAWGFHGLWGLDTHDSFGGERAPAGPRYERQGGVRRSWADPLGWAGLEAGAHRRRGGREPADPIDALTDRPQVLDRTVADERIALRSLQAEARSLGANADTGRRSASVLPSWFVGPRSPGPLVERSEVAEEREAHEEFLAPAGLEPGRPPRHVHLPDVVDRERHSAFPAVLGGRQQSRADPRDRPVTRSSAALLSGFAMFLLAFIAVEAVARRRVGLFFVGVAVAVVWVFIGAGLFVLFLRNWQPARLLILVALVLLVVNPGVRPPCPR